MSDSVFYARRAGTVGPVRTQIFGTTLVGVEMPGRCCVELSVRQGRVEVRSDDAFAIAPAASNVIHIEPNSSFDRSRVVVPGDKDITTEAALLATTALRGLIQTLNTVGSTKYASGRLSFQQEGLRLLKTIERAL